MRKRKLHTIKYLLPRAWLTLLHRPSSFPLAATEILHRIRQGNRFVGERILEYPAPCTD